MSYRYVQHRCRIRSCQTFVQKLLRSGTQMEGASVLRIGELSRRVGVSAELLRAWERRYGLLRPARSPGGLRLYSLKDVERIRLMREHLAGGLAAAEAAALATREEQPGGAASALDLSAARRDLAA